ncbi:MAG: pentapeptide repeat-containing protein, partial [Acidobacteria bacterium]|nr:pentapeptide repeat-containing protein [Acidobacteriota bacterium]
MANAGHVDIVRDRIDHWNEWRRKNTKVVPDFAGADLSELNLAGANLAKADFSGAKLAGTNLSGANLARAKFFRADLSQADLSQASFFKANLSQPVLSVDSLQTAQLVGMLLHHEKARYEVFSITLNT